ncbi:MAG: SMC-Scp complex subunit ScpB [Hyphomonadaceae bacterium]|nr:SMC-Scp complex subunit ScpB [Hyphomonadaceae bacterium]
MADQMRRIEDAFAEDGDERMRAPPSDDAIRAAEALLFAGGEPVTAKALGEKLGPPVDVAAGLMKLKADYAERSVQLVEAGGAWRFQSAPDLASLFAETREAPRKLPKAAMETLAVIAYHQPVTRAEIEEIRGVSLSRGSMELLLEIGWIRPRGRRRTPGRPLTFGTSDAFLSQFGLASLDALPGKDDLKALGLLDPRAAQAIDVPRPSEDMASDEEPLSQSDDAASFFVDHLEDES